MENTNFVYISSWDNFGGSAGLGLYRYQPEQGELTFVRMLDEVTSYGMSFVDESRGLLYILNETADLPEGELDAGGGRIFIYRIDRRNGGLTLLQCTPSYGANPCSFTLDPTGQFLVVLHHVSHDAVTKVRRDVDGKYRIFVEHDDVTIVLFPVNENGTLGDPLDVVYHTGWMQTKDVPRASLHSAAMAPSGEFFAVVDIGESRVHMYRIDYENKRLYPSCAPYADEPGSLPRYGLFHPTLPYYYINHEMGSLDVTCFRYDEIGRLTPLGKASSVPEGYVKQYHDEQQDFRMHPSGKYLYDAVNGPDVIAVFRIDEATGLVELVQNQKVDGTWVRGCALSPDGRFLIATCLKSGTVQVFAIGEDGLLTPTGTSYTQENASWVTFFNPQNTK